jgi:Family of unknown function (DUF6526)
MPEAQSFKNHAKIVPAFHFFVLPMLLVNFVWHAVHAVRHVGMNSILDALTALALLMVPLFARMFALKVQDRVIRLEMRLRLLEVLPPDLRARIGEFTPEQLIGLRFAPDAELPDLCRKVLTDRIAARKPIKMLIKNWQGDYLRA